MPESAAGAASVDQRFSRTQLDSLLAPLPNLRMVPVRHHSPRCSHHLQQLLAEFQPDLLLIEGPQEINALLPALRHPQARPPLAAYLHSELPGAEGALRCRSYLPFADFSPEWLALRHPAEVRFIDLAWGQRLAHSADPEFFVTAPEPLLAVEPAQQAPDVLKRLIEQAGCADFDGWWDRHFESGCAPASADEHFASLLAFSLLLRGDGRGDDAENQAREQQMAADLRTALGEQGRRILLVCGGFHLPGILARVADLLPQASTAALRALGCRLLPPLVALAAERETLGVHLIPYSLQRLAASSGYAAGLPHPGFYQRVWQDWQAGSAQPWQAGWPQLAARLTTDMRKSGLPVTLPDAAEAVGMAARLAALRGHPAGRDELVEALQSTLVRDSGDLPHFQRALAAQLAPPQLGSLPPNAPVAPLLQDVQAFCRQWQLPERPLPAKRRELDLYRSERHRQISRGLQRLRFLEVPYATREAGPDFVAGTELQRVRESWSLAWQLETATRLTELSRYGASLEEAAINRLLEQLQQAASSSGRAANPAHLVLEVLVMGLSPLAGRVLDAVAVWLEQSFDALQLAQLCSRLAQAVEARAALGAVEMPRLLPLLQRGWQQCCQHLPALGSGDAQQAAEAVDALADLHGMACRAAPWAVRELLLEACVALQQAAVAPSVRGAAAGVLVMSAHWDEEQTAAALGRELGRSQLAPVEMGEYLTGFLRIARGWLLGHPPTLQRLTDCIAVWDEEAFLAGLPPLRLAFSQLTRREQRQLAALLAGEGAGAKLLDLPLPDNQSLHASHALHALVSRVMHDWGFRD